MLILLDRDYKLRNLGGQFVFASPRSKFWGTRLPRPPVIYAHAAKMLFSRLWWAS